MAMLCNYTKLDSANFEIKNTVSTS